MQGMCTVENVVLAVTAYGKIFLRFNKLLLSALLLFYILYPVAYFSLFPSSQPATMFT
jgi:hypothetical protein